MTTIKWDKIRVLVTNKCNYRCPFCHNEGQSMDGQRDLMTFNRFKDLIDIISDEPISELNFSGGEPFLHPEIVKMIQYANERLKSDISCATNLSMITETQINELSSTRVKFNIQFPYVNKKEFAKSTGTGNLEKVVSNIKLIKEAGLKIGLNSVIQNLDIEALESMIQFSLKNELPLKFLPQIGLSGSDDFLKTIAPIIEKYSIEFVNKKTGCLKWKLTDGINQTVLLYIQSPCFNNDIETCKNFGEIRVQPDFSLQPCMLREPGEQLCLEKGKEYVINQFAKLWNDFVEC